MKDYRTTMYDDLFCPCCVCEAMAKADMQAMPPSQSVMLTSATEDSITDFSSEGIKVPRPLVTEQARSISDSLRSSHSSQSSRSLRLSMDGAITEYCGETQCCEIATLSPRPNVRRIVSLDTPKSLRTIHDLDSLSRLAMEEQRKPQSLSRLELKSPRQPRMQRRCSVTKFSLEQTLFQVQQEEQQQQLASSSSRLAPCIEEDQEHAPLQEPQTPRHRVRRRCSVTKYNLEDVLQVVQQEETAMTNSLSPCPENILVKEVDQSGHGLVATMESKRTFKARLPWGRAA